MNVKINISEMIKRDLKAKLASLKESDFINYTAFQSACMVESRKAIARFERYKTEEANRQRFLLQKKQALTSNQEISRFVWDAENCNFN